MSRRPGTAAPVRGARSSWFIVRPPGPSIRSRCPRPRPPPQRPERVLDRRLVQTVHRLGLRGSHTAAGLPGYLTQLPVLDRVGPGLLAPALLLALERDVAVGHDPVQPGSHFRPRREPVPGA